MFFSLQMQQRRGAAGGALGRPVGISSHPRQSHPPRVTPHSQKVLSLSHEGVTQLSHSSAMSRVTHGNVRLGSPPGDYCPPGGSQAVRGTLVGDCGVGAQVSPNRFSPVESPQESCTGPHASTQLTP